MARQPISRAVRETVLIESHGLCALCGLPVPESERNIDHVVPVAHGGTSSRENLQLTHGRCNRDKGPKGGRPLVYGERQSARLETHIPPDLRRRIRVAAAQRDVALSEWAKEAFEEKLAREGSRRDGPPATEEA